MDAGAEGLGDVLEAHELGSNPMLFFVDESGIDLHEAPCSVLAAVSFPESEAWSFAREFSILKAELLRLDEPDDYDAKGSKLLKRRVFQQAGREPAIALADRNTAIESLLSKNDKQINVTAFELTALAQAKLEFVDRALDLASKTGVKVFASIVPRDAPQQHDATFLRKDWAYLFQRIHCHVCDINEGEHGILLFDELDPALCQRLFRRFVATSLTRAGGAIAHSASCPCHSSFIPI